MTLSIYGYIAILLFVALLSSRLMHLLKLPNVTGYLLTGILVGPFIFGLLFNNFSFSTIKSGIIYQYVDRLKWVSSIALGFIAFNIGTSFKKSSLKAIGKKVLIITFFEAFGASLIVIMFLLIAHFIAPSFIGIELVLTLGAIASATAPAATLMVIKQYNAKGPLVNTLLPVVALDDAAALILFSLLFQLASALSFGNEISFYTTFLKPLIEIVLSLVFGLMIGFIITLMNRLFKSRNNRLAWCIFAIFASLGVYYLFQNEYLGGFELSSLLICMMAGATYINLVPDCNKTLDVMDRFTSAIYMMFFVLSGASLDLSIFFNKDGLIVVLISVVYVISRVIGKCVGSFTGAFIARSEPQVKKYLGFALIPQAGVAIGLATTAYNAFSSSPITSRIGSLVIATILTSTIIYELIGPMAAKFALKRAHEIDMNA